MKILSPFGPKIAKLKFSSKYSKVIFSFLETSSLTSGILKHPSLKFHSFPSSKEIFGLIKTFLKPFKKSHKKSRRLFRTVSGFFIY